MTLIPIYFTYFWYQNFTANALQIIRILIQHLLHGCHMDLVKKLGVTRLKLPRSKFFDPKKNERALLGKNRLVEDRSRKSDPRALLNQTRPSWITGFSLLILITFSLCFSGLVAESLRVWPASAEIAQSRTFWDCYSRTHCRLDAPLVVQPTASECVT